MKLFDTSSIFSAMKSGWPDILIDSYTIPLAEYEFANIIWKETCLSKTLTKKEGAMVLTQMKKVFESMVFLQPELKDIYQTSCTLNIPCYDSAFVTAAQQVNADLITEDQKLKKKVKNLITVHSLSDLSI